MFSAQFFIFIEHASTTAKKHVFVFSPPLSDRGSCIMEKCACADGWEGDACECPKSNQTCLDSKGVSEPADSYVSSHATLRATSGVTLSLLVTGYLQRVG